MSGILYGTSRHFLPDDEQLLSDAASPYYLHLDDTTINVPDTTTQDFTDVLDSYHISVRNEPLLTSPHLQHLTHLCPPFPSTSDNEKIALKSK